LILITHFSLGGASMLALFHGRLEWRVLQRSLHAGDNFGAAALLELCELHLFRGRQVGECPTRLQKTGAGR